MNCSEDIEPPRLGDYLSGEQCVCVLGCGTEKRQDLENLFLISVEQAVDMPTKRGI